MSTSTPSFRRGGEAAKEASKQKSFDKIPFFGMKSGEIVTLRLLTDFRERPNSTPGTTGWITVDQHSIVPTRPAPSDLKKEQKWPRSMGCVCRNDEVLREIFEGSGTKTACYICDEKRKSNGEMFKPQARNWAYAVLRDEVIEDGIIAGYKTKMRDVTRKDKEGQEITHSEPAVVKINLAYKNFFSKFEAVGNYRGTVLDRDFRITRVGDDEKTDYEVVAMDPIPNPDPDTSSEYPNWDMRNPKAVARMGAGDYCEGADHTHPQLAELVFEQCSDDFYDRFFDERHPIPTRKGDGKAESGPSESDQAKPDADVDDAKLAAMRDRVKGVQAASAPETPAAAVEELQPASAAAGPRNFD